MKVLVNAISIAEGGGVVVLKKLLEEINDHDSNITLHVAAKPNILSLIEKTCHIVAFPYSWANKTPLHHIFWYEVVLPRLIRQNKIDVVFSQTNFLPRFKLPCPSLLLVQHAGYFSKKFEQLYSDFYPQSLKKIAWKQKKKWLYQSINKATAVTVQTNALAKEIYDETKTSAVVIPHGSGLLDHIEGKTREFPTHTPWRIGYITKFGVQKDFDTAFKAIGLLKQAGISLKLILTLCTKNPEYESILRLIKKYDIEDVIENKGEVSQSELMKMVYDTLHIFIFPSLCESFGFTLVEAMKSSLPIVVADTSSNREVSGIAGNLYKPENEKELAEKIFHLMNNKELYITASKNSFERSKDFCWQQSAKHILDVMYKLTYEKK